MRPAAGGLRRGGPVCAGRHPELYRYRPADGPVCSVCHAEHRLPVPLCVPGGAGAYHCPEGKRRKAPAGRPIRADRPVPGYEHPHQPAQPGRGGGRHGSALRGSVGPAEQRRGAGQPDWHHSGPVGGNPDFLWPLSAPAGGSVRPSPWLCLEAICRKMPHLPAAGTAHAGAEQRHFEHHAGAACFQPDVPPPLAGG